MNPDHKSAGLGRNRSRTSPKPVTTAQDAEHDDAEDNDVVAQEMARRKHHPAEAIGGSHQLCRHHGGKGNGEGDARTTEDQR
jgi:hypothetical protein